MTRKGRRIIDHDITAAADKASDRLEFLVGESGDIFDAERIIRPDPAAFDDAWKVSRMGWRDVPSMIGSQVVPISVLAATAPICVGLVRNFLGASFPQYGDLVVAGLCGIVALFMLGWLAFVTFVAAGILSRGFEDTWEFEKLAAQAWYIGDRGLHTVYGGFRRTVLYDAIGAAVISGNELNVRKRDGSALDTILSPSGGGMTANEIATKLNERIKEAAKG
jgi:hypothetical protein